MPHRLAVVVPTPAHSSISGPLSYLSELPLAPGTLVRVPLGRREVLGVVWDRRRTATAASPGPTASPSPAPWTASPPLSAGWRQLVTFAANYYQRSLGEVALAALPPQLRDTRLRPAGAPLEAPGATRPPPSSHAAAAAADARTARGAGRDRGGRRALSCCSAPPAAARPRSTCARCRRCWPRAAGAGPGAGARDQPHAAAAGALRRALRRRRRGARCTAA